MVLRVVVASRLCQTEVLLLHVLPQLQCNSKYDFLIFPQQHHHLDESDTAVATRTNAAAECPRTRATTAQRTHVTILARSTVRNLVYTAFRVNRNPNRDQSSKTQCWTRFRHDNMTRYIYDRNTSIMKQTMESSTTLWQHQMHPALLASSSFACCEPTTYSS